MYIKEFIKQLTAIIEDSNYIKYKETYYESFYESYRVYIDYDEYSCITLKYDEKDIAELSLLGYWEKSIDEYDNIELGINNREEILEFLESEGIEIFKKVT